MLLFRCGDDIRTLARRESVGRHIVVHCLVLDEVGLIEYDSDQQLVESGSELQSALEILRYVE
ncbi:hypothetical protein [Halobellus sp. H-GB7]|uniref:hypothetical protein n=1 Tax=Halobellus sp. H-GB7 TaxID=3069756 RepID=UPI0027ADE7FD|nr:hypothetical protein [Halobellus sp. H-GB7]MDQ2056379.1 hypothetical protein [Halobellus sp. H-GB7]